jgi:hypothetical protein
MLINFFKKEKKIPGFGKPVTRKNTEKRGQKGQPAMSQNPLIIRPTQTFCLQA